jgi:hypothetical protein
MTTATTGKQMSAANPATARKAQRDSTANLRERVNRKCVEPFTPR